MSTSSGTTGAPSVVDNRYVALVVGATALVVVALPLTAVLGRMEVSWPVLDGAVAVAGTTTALCGLLPWDTLRQRQSGPLVLYAWSLVDIGGIGAAVAATGGERSSFWVLLVLTTIFFAAGYRFAGQVGLLGATLTCYVAAVAASGTALVTGNLLWKLCILLVAFGLTSYSSVEIRRQLAEHRRAHQEADRRAGALAVQEQWWRSLLNGTSDPIVVFDQHWRVTFASSAIALVLGYRPVDLRALDLRGLVHPADVDDLAQAAEAVWAGREPSTSTCRLRRADSSWRYVEVSLAVLGAPGGGLVATLHDVSERVATEVALTHQATHDPLTNLANRTAFYEALRACLSRSSRTRSALAVMVLDLAGFKVVNDTLGHAVGDELLVEVARRVAGTIRAADVAARLGGDEFAVVLATGDRLGATATAQRILEAVGAPLVLAGQWYWLRSSIGVACSPEHGTEAEALVQRADRAMYEAKRTGTGMAVYEPHMESHHADVPGLLAELRHAVTEGGLHLHYQPKVAVPSGQVLGVEALVRWDHPRLGPLAPSAFLPVAEASGLVHELTAWVLPVALGQLRRWIDAGWNLSVAVNLSAYDLLDEAFVEQVAGWLHQAGVPADHLTLELTETSAIADRERGASTLARLRSLGVRVSLDDFGSGYASLACLAELPLDEVKLDRRFLTAGVGVDGFVVRSVVEIGHHLGLAVVAEGVETTEVLSQLIDLGVDAVQGYVFARPAPATELAAVLEMAYPGEPSGPVTPKLRTGGEAPA